MGSRIQNALKYTSGFSFVLINSTPLIPELIRQFLIKTFHDEGLENTHFGYQYAQYGQEFKD